MFRFDRRARIDRNSARVGDIERASDRETCRSKETELISRTQIALVSDRDVAGRGECTLRADLEARAIRQENRLDRFRRRW